MSKSFKTGCSSTGTKNFQMDKLGLEKVKQTANIHWIMEKAREFQKNIYFCFMDYAKASDSGSQRTVENWKRWKFHHITCLPRNLYVRQEATVRTGHWTTDWFKTGKGVWQGYIISCCLFNLHAEYIIWNAGLDESQAGIKIARRNINNPRYADDTTLMAESEEELKSLLMRVKQESEKAGLKLNIQNTKIMASGPITSWQTKGIEWKQWQILFSWAPKSLQMVTTTRKFAPWKESYDKPRQCIKKAETLLCQQRSMYSQSYSFFSSHVWMWELDHKEGWVSKNWCFQIMLEKTLKCPLDCKMIKLVNPKGNQPWIFTGRTKIEAEAPTLWPPDVKSQLTGKDPDAGKGFG